LDQELVLQLAQVDVVAEVREAAEVAERVVEAGEQVGVVRLELPLSVGAEADQLLSHLMRVGVQLRHVGGARRGTQAMTRSVNSASTSGPGLSEGSLEMAAWRPVIF
jgi:hypothetical protein